MATLWFVLLAVAATGPALFLDRSLGPESFMDSDPLFALGNPPPRAIISDWSRTLYDLPHDFAAADGFHAGRFDLWNPRVGLGAPLWSEGGAPFFPLKIPFYLMPSRARRRWRQRRELTVRLVMHAPTHEDVETPRRRALDFEVVDAPGSGVVGPKGNSPL